jgi:hypothetical protein
MDSTLAEQGHGHDSRVLRASTSNLQNPGALGVSSPSDKYSGGRNSGGDRRSGGVAVAWTPPDRSWVIGIAGEAGDVKGRPVSETGRSDP